MRHLGLALQNAGYEVRVICPKGENQDRSSFEVVQGIRVYRYPMLHQASGGLGYLFEYSWAFLCTTLLSLFVWLHDGFDIIHSANPPDIFFLLAWPYKLLGKKYVYDQHDVCPELYESKFERRDSAYRALLLLEKLSFRVADLVISTNQSYREIARARGGIGDERSVIVRNGVDRKQFYRRMLRQELKDPFPYMGLVSRSHGETGRRKSCCPNGAPPGSYLWTTGCAVLNGGQWRMLAGITGPKPGTRGWRNDAVCRTHPR